MKRKKKIVDPLENAVAILEVLVKLKDMKDLGFNSLAEARWHEETKPITWFNAREAILEYRMSQRKNSDLPF